MSDASDARRAPSRLPSRLPWREAALLALALGGGLALGLWKDRGSDAEAARAATLAMGPGAGVASLGVRTAEGRDTSLRRIGAPAVVMVVSTSCGVCKEALRDFGRMTNGAPLPGLWLLTLEGASLGAPMLQAAGVRGATLVGPPTPAQEAFFTFQIQGTPTFVALDARGVVRGVLPGYPGREKIATWLAVMRGTRATP